MQSIFIRVVNFEKYKGRRDVTHNSWFRCSNRLLEDPDFFEFSHSELLVWIYILSLTSQKNSDVVEVNFAHAERVGRLKKSIVQKAMQKLMGKQILPADVTPTLRESIGNDTDACATIHNKTIQTEQNNTNNTISSESEASPSVPEVEGIEHLSFFKEIAPIGNDLVREWLKAYPQNWIEDEFGKAKRWCLTNPAKKPKANPGKFLNGWLARNWDAYRKTLPTEKPKSDYSFLNKAGASA